ncbi:hypothetical protein OPQ81_005165 [Rhizoctonia solani]|nr:hypothetical protein OPQ81_005165 [Rhizoctonia solani]
MDWSVNAILLGYGELWRHYRRMMNNWLNARAVTQLRPIQEQQIQPLLRRLVRIEGDQNPFEKVKHALFYNSAASMLKLGYGYPLQGDNDPVFQDMQRNNENAVLAEIFTNFLVNIFPSLICLPDWFPGTGWKRTAREWRALKERSQSVPCEWTKAQLGVGQAAGAPEPSILSALLQNHKLVSELSEKDKESRLKEVASMIVAAGTDTTSRVLIAFVAAMVLNPHVQEKAQKELDNVIGPTLLPTMADRERLPYIRNLIQEVLRWQPVNTKGTLWIAISLYNHAANKRGHLYQALPMHAGRMTPMKDMISKREQSCKLSPEDAIEWAELKGLHLSRIGNFWAMIRDETIYKDSEIFNPDRYQDPNVPYAPAFGWGRRKCPGMHFAEASLFIIISSLLATFTFAKKADPDGKEKTPKIEGVSNAIIMELKPFDFELRLRPVAHRQLILE